MNTYEIARQALRRHALQAYKIDIQTNTLPELYDFHRQNDEVIIFIQSKDGNVFGPRMSVTC